MNLIFSPMGENRDRFVAGCFILGSGLLLLINLGLRTLENHDYLRHAEVAREMIRSGDWVVLRLNGEIYLDKLPLFFWLIGLPASAYGAVTPFLARLPSALSAWIGVIVLFFWAKRVYQSPWIGVLSGAILLSSYQFFLYARAARPDMVLTMLIILSLYFFDRGCEDEKEPRRRALFYGLSFLFMGLLFLTKGPLAVLMPFAVMTAFLVKERKLDLLASRPFLLGYGVMAGTILPWVFLFLSRIGFEEALLLVQENRVLTRQAPFYLYFGKIWAEFMPWSLLLPFLGAFVWRRWKEVWSSRESFFLIWFLLLFVGLTLMPYRASRYLLPLLPALAMMLGGFGKGKVKWFLIPALLSLVVWHGVEIHWATRNPSRSPGMTLTREIKTLTGEGPLYGYRLDGSTLEELNFYLDRLTPNLKRYEEVRRALGERKALVLVPERLYEKIRKDRNNSVVTVGIIPYKDERLVLISGGRP